MTLKEIAEAAGVSIGTVDRVLYGRGRVSPETRAAVERIVAKSGYKPNPLAKHLKRGKGYRFLVVAPEAGDDEGYWSLARRGVASAAASLAPFGIAVEFKPFERYTAGAAAKALTEAADEGADALLVAPVNGEEMRPVLESGKPFPPYAFFDAYLPGLRPLCSIGQDGHRSGLLAGRLMSLFAPGASRIAAVNPHRGDHHLDARVEGFRAWFGGRQGVEIIETDREGLRSRGHSVEGIFVANASVAETLGPLRSEASAKAARERRPAVIGYDLVPENAALLASGVIDCLISQDPEFQAREGVMALYRGTILGDGLPERIEAPLDVYLRENMPRPGEGRA